MDCRARVASGFPFDTAHRRRCVLLVYERHGFFQLLHTVSCTGMAPLLRICVVAPRTTATSKSTSASSTRAPRATKRGTRCASACASTSTLCTLIRCVGVVCVGVWVVCLADSILTQKSVFVHTAGIMTVPLIEQPTAVIGPIAVAYRRSLFFEPRTCSIVHCRSHVSSCVCSSPDRSGLSHVCVRRCV